MPVLTWYIAGSSSPSQCARADETYRCIEARAAILTRGHAPRVALDACNKVHAYLTSERCKLLYYTDI